VADNVTTRTKLVAKKEMKDTNIEHTTNQIWKQCEIEMLHKYARKTMDVTIIMKLES
jgi:hypothetical protein